MPALYRIGQQIDLRATFTAAGELGDPATVSIRIHSPDGTVLTRTHPTNGDVARESLGKYLYILTPTLSGIYDYEWSSTGAIVTAEERQLIVAREGT